MSDKFLSLSPLTDGKACGRACAATQTVCLCVCHQLRRMDRQTATTTLAAAAAAGGVAPQRGFLFAG